MYSKIHSLKLIMLNFKFTIARSHFRIWVAILSINGKVKGYKVSRQVYWCQSCRRGRKRDQPVCQEDRRARIAGGDLLCALVHNYSRTCTGNRHSTVDRTCRRYYSTDSTPKSCDLIRVSSSNRFQRIHHTIYRNLSKYHSWLCSS